MEYEVKPQEGITEISEKFGLNDLTIWNHSKNAALRKKRPDLNNLLAGDLVFIPATENKVIICQAEQKYRFKRKGIPAIYRLQLFKGGKPRANQDYILDVDGTLFTGKTNNKGVLREYISPKSRKGKLTLNKDNVSLKVMFGALGPSTENIGIQQRLAHLGYSCGEIDNDSEFNPETVAALKHFQTLIHAEPTGIVDDRTRDAIVKVHDTLNVQGST